MELNEIWLWYVNEHTVANAAARPSLEFRAWDTLERFFDLHPMITARYDAINTTRYSMEFDNVADGALAQMAMSDSFAGWEELPAGGWRVISERLLYSEVVLGVMAAKEQGTVIDRLPLGLTKERQAKALLLKYLLGHGRTIDRKVLPTRPDGSLPEFPAAQTLRRQ